MAVSSYRDLKVWQKAMDLVVECYKTTRDFPKDELYGLTSQLRRAAVSVPANVAEGHSRPNTREFLHLSWNCVRFACGSANPHRNRTSPQVSKQSAHRIVTCHFERSRPDAQRPGQRSASS
jgi:23S rRNA-intervening sequence protein